MATVWYFESRKDNDYGGYFDGVPEDGILYRTKEAAERARDAWASNADARRLDRERREYHGRVHRRTEDQKRWDILNQAGLALGVRPVDLPPLEPLPQLEIERQYHIDSYELED